MAGVTSLNHHRTDRADWPHYPSISNRIVRENVQLVAGAQFVHMELVLHTERKPL